MHVRLASAQLYLWNMLEEANINPEPLFRKARLDPVLMHTPGAKYPIQRIRALIREVGETVHDPCFGLMIDKSWHPSHLGVLGHVLMMSKTLRQTLERLIRYHEVISDSDVGELREDRLKKTLSFVANYEGRPMAQSPMREQAGITWLTSLLRLNYQRNLTPTAVDFAHSEPSCVGKLYEYFQCPIRFDQEEVRLVLPLDVVDEPLPGHTDELASCSDQLMRRYLESLNELDLITRVKRAIIEYLPSGDATVEMVASDLYMSTRTLQRSLQRESTSFNKVLNDVRLDLAMDYVSDSKKDLTEVAFLLGFSELSSFSRSFKRWTGKSPAKYRRAA